jgi:hypothetical protein
LYRAVHVASCGEGTTEHLLWYFGAGDSDVDVAVQVETLIDADGSADGEVEDGSADEALEGDALGGAEGATGAGLRECLFRACVNCRRSLCTFRELLLAQLHKRE